MSGRPRVRRYRTGWGTCWDRQDNRISLPSKLQRTMTVMPVGPPAAGLTLASVSAGTLPAGGAAGGAGGIR
jgi:hypothetical protein